MDVSPGCDIAAVVVVVKGWACWITGWMRRRVVVDLEVDFNGEGRTCILA